jgi:GAF domain-containing protein
VSQAVNSTLDLETVLATVVAKAMQLSSPDAGAIYTLEESGREFEIRATHGSAWLIDPSPLVSICANRLCAILPAAGQDLPPSRGAAASPPPPQDRKGTNGITSTWSGPQRVSGDCGRRGRRLNDKSVQFFLQP